MRHFFAIFLLITVALGQQAVAQTTPLNLGSGRLDGPNWAHCTQLNQDAVARLACFDRWAQQQTQATPALSIDPPTLPPPAWPAATLPTLAAIAPVDCRDGKQSEVSRFWELESGSDCGRFSLRNYRPVSLSWIYADSVNLAPSSPASGHTAIDQPYLKSEGRIQLSVRSKLAHGFLTDPDSEARDSLWFAYSQQSYWQIFSPSISRPFRSTDHEPEIMYILPTDFKLPLGWRLRYSGLSLNHQSNGQSLPLSRSWNRIIFMAGMEKDDRFSVNARFWQRVPEDSAEDDNPDISDTIGRAEVAASWHMDKRNTLGLTVRHSLNADAKGSFRFEWLKSVGDSGRSERDSGLRLHVQLFSGYGDSLMDYNRQRTVLSVGLSLVDW